MTIAAIPTRYKGFHFRSRLEARWAVLLDVLEIEWRYEDQGFDLNGERYLPDFWLPKLGIFLEVKGQWPDDREQALAELLSKESGHPVLIVIELPGGNGDSGYLAFGTEFILEVPIAIMSCRASALLEIDTGAPDGWGERITCPVCGFDYVHFCGPLLQCFTATDDYDAWQGRGSCLRVRMWGECGHSWDMRLGFHKGNMYLAFENASEHRHGIEAALCNGDTGALEKASCAARSARFEHGQCGAS